VHADYATSSVRDVYEPLTVEIEWRTSDTVDSGERTSVGQSHHIQRSLVHERRKAADGNTPGYLQLLELEKRYRKGRRPFSGHAHVECRAHEKDRQHPSHLISPVAAPRQLHP